jgi:hypothetical protein
MIVSPAVVAEDMLDGIFVRHSLTAFALNLNLDVRAVVVTNAFDFQQRRLIAVPTLAAGRAGWISDLK